MVIKITAANRVFMKGGLLSGGSPFCGYLAWYYHSSFAHCYSALHKYPNH